MIPPPFLLWNFSENLSVLVGGGFPKSLRVFNIFSTIHINLCLERVFNVFFWGGGSLQWPLYQWYNITFNFLSSFKLLTSLQIFCQIILQLPSVQLLRVVQYHSTTVPMYHSTSVPQSHSPTVPLVQLGSFISPLESLHWKVSKCVSCSNCSKSVSSPWIIYADHLPAITVTV